MSATSLTVGRVNQTNLSERSRESKRQVNSIAPVFAIVEFDRRRFFLIVNATFPNMISPVSNDDFQTSEAVNIKRIICTSDTERK